MSEARVPATRLGRTLAAAREHGWGWLLEQALHRRGVKTFRFWYLSEEPTEATLRQYSTLPSDLTLTEFGSAEVERICAMVDEGAPMDAAQVLENFRLGCRCLGFKRGDDIVGFTWYSLEASDRRIFPVWLEPNEAYLFNIYVRPEERGRDLAPILRTQVYRTLMDQGRDTFYSITTLRNGPSWRFKQKLGARKLFLAWYLDFRQRYRKTVVLRRYARTTVLERERTAGAPG